ncbi:MAG: Hsp33 family molecular chaperone HslO [Lachnospiraceae bacterium]|jgi:molecular chaperone Hsp33|nr:Hsp33 family molecular chaperone HslO [Lachnospiraceae bacterium]
MSDYIVRAIADNGNIRAFASLTTDTVEEARCRHKSSPVATKALGRLLTAAGIMGDMMKGEDDLLTLIIRGKGPLEGITVTADSKADVKGYAYVPDITLPERDGEVDVSGVIGEGTFQVIMDLGLKEPYVSTINLVNSQIDTDIAYYYSSSEQIPSAVSLDVCLDSSGKVVAAGGFFIQLMPFADTSLIDKINEKIQELPKLSLLLEMGKTPEDILNMILGDMDLEITQKVPTRFFCNCSKERVASAIISIGKKDLEEIIKDNEPIEVKCDFCSTYYNYSVEDLKELYNQAK